MKSETAKEADDGSDKLSPIFIVGTQRSGSNLLRVMLNAHSKIAAPHPPHLLHVFQPLLPAYGDLDAGQNFLALAQDVCRLVEVNPVPWRKFDTTAADLIKMCRDRTLVALLEALYGSYAQRHNAQGWCCKSTFNVWHLPLLEKDLSDKAKYIHLYRDGRDVALSFANVPVGDKHFHHLAQQWHSEQQMALQLPEMVGSQRVFQLSYENLVSQPEATLRQLCRFLGIGYEPAMLEYPKSEESQSTATSGGMWQNLAKPPSKSHIGRFLHENTKPFDIHIFETVAGETLQMLGYELHVLPEKGKLTISPEMVKEFELENRRLKEAALQKISPSERLKHEPRQAFLQQLPKSLA